MKRICSLLLFVVCLAANAGTPTDASIERLLLITRAESLMDMMFAQIEQSIRTGMKTATQGRQLNPAQLKALEVAPAKLAAAMRQDLNWPSLNPMFVEIYRETLDQSDVDGMIAFYETPAGQATISKMPAIMQKSMLLTQDRFQSIVPRLQAAMKEALEEAGIQQ